MTSGISPKNQNKTIMIQINELAREYLYEIGVSQLKVVELNGEHFAYCVDTHQSEYNYTQRKVYLIFTDRERWAGGVLPQVLNDDSISIGEYKYLNEQHPCFENHLKEHHKVEYREAFDCYEYTIITPYDD